MLYQMHTQSRVLLHPLMQWANNSAQQWTNQYFPLAHTPFAKQMAANCELLYRLGKQYDKPLFAIDSVLINDQAVTITEEIVLSKAFCTLLHFKKQPTAGQTTALNQAKVLLVAPLSGHHATLLRDTVRGLLPDHDVYITDWTDARMVPLAQGTFHLHDYIYYVQDFIRLLGPELHVISVCQPTVPVLAAISLLATEKDAHLPKSMTMMGGPIDPRISPTKVNLLATEKPFSWFENTVIYRVPANYPGAGRKVYPGFLQYAGFIAMNPERHAKSYQKFYEDLASGEDISAEQHRQFYNEYNAVLDMSADYYLETIQTVFQDFSLPLGTWDVEGKRVRPQDISSVALFTIEGALDDISGAGQTHAAHTLCSNIPESKRQQYTAPECGHFGIFSGRRWRETVCPKITAFIKENS